MKKLLKNVAKNALQTLKIFAIILSTIFNIKEPPMSHKEHDGQSGYEEQFLTNIADDMTNTSDYAALNFDIRSKKQRIKQITHYGLLAVLFGILTVLTPIVLPQFPLYSITPALFLLLYIFFTRRVFESLTLSIVLGFMMGVSVDAFDGSGFFESINTSLISNVANENTAWLFIVCGLMGSFIVLIEKAGGVYAFGLWVAKRAKTRRATLVWTWLLGLIIFVDDYLNSLTVGSCMAPLTDKHKVSREYLAYVVDSTAAPDTTLIPVSTWAVFIAALYSSTIAERGITNLPSNGLLVFVSAIPFNFYAIFCLLMVPLTIFGVIPIFGKMKKAEKRAKETGVLAPPGSEKIDIRGGEALLEQKDAKVRNFFIPLFVLIGTTLYFDLDLQWGVISTLAFMFVFYLVQGLVDADEFFTLVVKGFKNMLMPLLMVILAYMFADGLNALGFSHYTESFVSANVSPWMLPALIFLVFGFTEFIMGLSWGMYAFAIPMVTGIASTMNVNPAILIAAVISAGVWGSHICFYSDATILSSSAAGCDNYEHATTQLPYGLIAAAFSLVSFVIAGLIFL
jgi:tetracycline resistance efflux pump